MRMRRVLGLLMPIFVLLLLLSSTPLPGVILGADRGAAPAHTPHASPPIAECGWEQQASAWLDVNTNGRRESGEGPLAGVEFLVKGLDSGWEYGLEGTSDGAGQAALRIFLAGCPDDRLEVTARPPAGYRATTAAVVESRRRAPSPVKFGFIAAP